MAVTTERRDRLVALVRPAVAAAGYDLEELRVASKGSRTVLTVVVDGDDGINLDAIATVSRDVAAVLDADDALAGPAPYVLEVTSPGIDRPLTLPRHWRRAAGRLVRATVTVAGTAETVTGRVAAADEDAVDFDLDGEPRRIRYADLSKGRVQVEFNRPDPTAKEGRR